MARGDTTRGDTARARNDFKYSGNELVNNGKRR